MTQKLLKGQRRPATESDNGGAAIGGARSPVAGVQPVGLGGESSDEAPELPLQRSDVTPEVRERLLDLRTELAALRKVLSDVIG